MKKNHSLFIALFALIISLAPGLRGAELTADDKQFLLAYENVRAGLAADDLAAARKAAQPMGERGAALLQSSSLKEARAAFDKLSADAIKLTENLPGYHVVHCDMFKKDWVQTSTRISNPYGGKQMPDCGELKK